MVRLAALRAAEQARKEAATPFVPKPVEEGEAFKTQPKPMARDIAQEVKVKTATGIGQGGLDVLRLKAPDMYTKLITEEMKRLSARRDSAGSVGAGDAAAGAQPLEEAPPTPASAKPKLSLWQRLTAKNINPPSAAKE